MPTNSRGGKRGSNASREKRNNNPEGRNQYSGIMNTARGNPLATAAAVGGAVAAGIFLWSRRNQISDEISSLSDQITEWREATVSQGNLAGNTASSDTVKPSRVSRGRGHRTQAEIAEEALTLKEIGEAPSPPSP